MNSPAHPILTELARQLPESAHTFQLIEQAKDFEKIASQARQEMRCLEHLDGSSDNGPSARSMLDQSGYQNWLKECDPEERLRVIGALRLIADLSEDLAEE